MPGGFSSSMPGGFGGGMGSGSSEQIKDKTVEHDLNLSLEDVCGFA